MSEDILRIIDESINLERNIASLYIFFHGIYPDDSDFWWKLALEETNHASLLESGRDYFMPADELFPYQIIPTSLGFITKTISEIETRLEEYKTSTPSRESAFNLALKLEESTGELHFQQTITMENSNSEALELFKRLNKEDKDHALRIREYMTDKGLGIKTS